MTTLSKERGYGEAGGEGLYSSVTIIESLTHRIAVPPLPQAGEGCHRLLFRGQIKCPNLSFRACSLGYTISPLGGWEMIGRCTSLAGVLKKAFCHAGAQRSIALRFLKTQKADPSLHSG